MRLTSPLGPALAGGLVASCLVLVPAAPAYAETDECSALTYDDEVGDQATEDSLPLLQLQIDKAQRLVRERSGTQPGAGIGVAVLDSGVSTRAFDINVASAPPVHRSPSLPVLSGDQVGGFFDAQGTVVAGLIAGASRSGGRLVGIAPAATVYDVRVLDTPVRQEDAADQLGNPDAQSVAEGLQWVLDNARQVEPPIKIVNVSPAVEPSDELEAVVKRLEAEGVVVVAASGNRPGDGDLDEGSPLAQFQYEEGEERPPGEDAADVVFPAGYDSVLAVSASAGPEDDVGEVVLPNSQTDLAAPTDQSVSYALTGQTCLNYDLNTALAAAEVSGVLALLWSQNPSQPAAKVVARLVRTATGTATTSNVFTGHGVIQPTEALTRQLQPDNRGRIGGSVIREDENVRAEVPRQKADLLARARENAVWLGLFGGGLLVVAVLLRPVLARRRDR